MRLYTSLRAGLFSIACRCRCESMVKTGADSVGQRYPKTA